MLRAAYVIKKYILLCWSWEFILKSKSSSVFFELSGTFGLSYPYIGPRPGNEKKKKKKKSFSHFLKENLLNL